jgi:hypothetical protein
MYKENGKRFPVRKNGKIGISETNLLIVGLVGETFLLLFHKWKPKCLMTNGLTSIAVESDDV